MPRRWLIGACIALALPAGAAAAETCPTQPNKVRYQDDVACFLEPGNRTGWPGAVKALPLNGSGEAFLSLGGGIRQRYEYTRDPLFGADPQDDLGVWLQRYSVFGDLRLGPHVRAFAELSSALAFGREGGAGPVDENELALQNGFVDLSFAPAEGAWLTLRPGRQELQYGSGRLIDVRDGTNVRRTFDAARSILELPNWRIDALAARPRTPKPGVFDDSTNDDRALWGVYAAGEPALLPAGSADLYYLGFHDDEGTFVQGSADEQRHSFGLRLWGEELGWDWNVEAVYQFGSFGDGDISAWTLASQTGFTFAALPWQPRIALSTNIASGDTDADDADLGTFNPLFPRGNYFSEDAVLGPRNFFNVHPFVTVQPTASWSFTADMNFFWRLETEDGVYAPGGQIIREPDGSRERYVGSALSLTSEHEIADNLIFTAIYTHFFAGDFLRETGPSEDIDYVELTVEYKF